MSVIHTAYATMKISNMHGIPREAIEHKLEIDPLFKPIKQKERRYTTEMHETIRQGVNRLLEVGFIRLVDYLGRLANLVLIEKDDGSWRMCIDYTSLNKEYPKDESPLSHICQIVDSTTSCKLLSFLDAYSGNHQISLTIDDEEKTAFITPFRIISSWKKHKDGVRPQEQRSYISEGQSYHLGKSDWTKHRGKH
jgi:hypothetical protein